MVYVMFHFSTSILSSSFFLKNLFFVARLVFLIIIIVENAIVVRPQQFRLGFFSVFDLRNMWFF